METAAPIQSFHPRRGVLLLALANVVGFLLLMWFTTLFYASYIQLPLLIAMQNAARSSQWQSYGIAAALIPQRRFVGLAWAIGLGLVSGLIYATMISVLSMSRRGVWLPLDEWPLRMSVPAYETSGMFIVVQAMRFTLGWRIAPAGESSDFQRGQFRIGELLEWTAAIGVWLGISQFIKVPVASLIHYIMAIVSGALIIIPTALAIMSPRGLRGTTVLALSIWIAAVELFFNLLGYTLDPAAYPGPWWFWVIMSLGSVAGYLFVTGINFAIIRRLGFRWRLVTHGPLASATPSAYAKTQTSPRR
jgi:hypothetical protein